LNVGHPAAAGDHSRTPIDVAVPHPSRRLIPGIRAAQQLTAKHRAEDCERTLVHGRKIDERLSHLDHPHSAHVVPTPCAIHILVLRTADRNTPIDHGPPDEAEVTPRVADTLGVRSAATEATQTLRQQTGDTGQRLRL
jgi:hypothetical protein